MNVKKIVIACFLLTLSSSLFAVDSAEFNDGLKSLETKTVKLLKKCKAEEECVKGEYSNFKDKRDKLVKKQLKVSPKKFNKAAKKVLAKEEECIIETPAKAQKCFDKSFDGISKAVEKL